MDDLGFGLWMTLMGMGTVFLLLLVLMLILRLVGWLDGRGQRQALAGEAEVEALDVVEDGAVPGLTDDEVAAIALAVITHARVRRLQAAPAMRAHEPGSHLFASRWVAIGRGYQHQPWTRGN